MKINVKITSAIILICLIPLIAVTIFINNVTANSITTQALNHLESVASIQHARTHMVLEKYSERLALVASDTQLRTSMYNYINENNSVDQELMNRILVDTQSAITGFQNIAVLNLDGEVVASSDDEWIGTNHVDEEYFIRGLAESSVDMLFLDDNGNLKVHFSGPMILEDELIGVVVIEASTRSIMSMVTDYSGLGETGETLIAMRDENGDALFITPLRFDPDAALTRSVSKEDLELPITQALLGNEQLYSDTIDYRGKPVLSATRYIDDVDWGLVVKIDKAEAFSPIVALRNSTLITILVSIFAIILVSIFISRRLTRPLVDLTRTAAEIGAGDLSKRVALTTKDEIGDLARTFDEMAEKLAGAHAGLEQQVKERTAELEMEITERKRAEGELKKHRDHLEELVEERTKHLEEKSQELSEINVLLEEASRHKSEFLANMSHELRTPLNSIIGYTKLILDGVEGEIKKEQRKDLEIVHSNSQHLLQLINDLLDITKIEAGRIELQWQEFSVSDLLAEAVPPMQRLAEEKGLTLAYDVAAGIDKLYGDKGRVRQVLLNILGNAVKFTGEGGIDLRVSESDTDFTFSVTDTGIGIGEDDLETIFDSFEQVDRAQVLGYEGTGLGLTISKHFVEMHGGMMQANSEPGKGSTFTFTLPKKGAD